MKCRMCGLRVFSGSHFDEAEALGAAGFAVHHHLGGGNAAELRKVALQDGIGDGEGQALLVCDDPADAPVAEDLVVHEAVLADGDVVGVADDEAVRPVEVAARVVLLFTTVARWLFFNNS